MGAPLRVAVIGTGRAGRARARDLGAAAGCALAGVVSMRRDGAAGVDRVARDPEVDAVIVATDNASHAAIARQMLEAEKHVTVEFPLCARLDEARSLFALAGARDRVLHVELIGLLASPHRALRDALGEEASRGRGLETLRATFQGDLYRWLGEELSAGRVGQLAVGRLHALWDLAGPLALESARLDRGGGAARLEVALRGHGDADVRLEISRGPGLSRRSEMVARTRGGRHFEGGRATAEPLFRQDLMAFMRQIRTAGRQGAYVSREDVLGVVALAEDISGAVASDRASGPAGG